MKKLFLRLLIFIVPILALLYLLPVNNRLLYAGLSSDCGNRAIWLHDWLYNNPKTADIVFLGTSHTINGIDDEYVEQQLKSKNIKIINMGYCSFGVNLYYHLLKELIKHKKPRQIVIEIRNEEDRYTHPIFAYVSSNSDVLTEPLLFNRDYLKDNYMHLYYKLEVIHNLTFGNTTNATIRTENYGCRNFSDTAPSDMLNNIKTERQKPHPPEPKWESDFNMAYPRAWYTRIGKLCRDNNISIIFLYIPAFGEPYKLPEEYSTYTQYGKVLMPPDSLFGNIHYWFDEGHLNKAGAKALSEWIAAQICHAR